MTVSIAKTTVTADELPALSARLSILGKRTELVRGDLVVMAPAGGRHGQVAHRLGLFIGNHVLERNLGRVFAAETGFVLRRDPDTVRAPDAAFVAGERLGAAAPPEQEGARARHQALGILREGPAEPGRHHRPRRSRG